MVDVNTTFLEISPVLERKQHPFLWSVLGIVILDLAILFVIFLPVHKAQAESSRTSAESASLAQDTDKPSPLGPVATAAKKKR